MNLLIGVNRENIFSITRNKDNFTKETKALSLIDAYHYYIDMANELREKSDGKFNLYKCGCYEEYGFESFLFSHKSHSTR